MSIQISQMFQHGFENGSKQHIMSQCVYFAFRTIVIFGVFFSRKYVFLKRNFQMKCFETFYILYLQLPQYVMFFSNQILKKYQFLKMHIFCQILCFVLKFFHNFKSYQNLLTLSSLIFYVITYKFSLNNIYIPSHLHVKKDS